MTKMAMSCSSRWLCGEELDGFGPSGRMICIGSVYHGYAII